MSEHRALVVDDEPDIRELLAITLARMDVACTSAADIAAAQALLGQRFDLCLTDMRLPDGDGSNSCSTSHGGTRVYRWP